jgi:hypothetical protein
MVVVVSGHGLFDRVATTEIDYLKLLILANIFLSLTSIRFYISVISRRYLISRWRPFNGLMTSRIDSIPVLFGFSPSAMLFVTVSSPAVLLPTLIPQILFIIPRCRDRVES